MKEFLSTRTIGDWILYGVVLLIVVGTVLFVFGFFFNFKELQILDISTKTNINKMCSKNGTNLFMLKQHMSDLGNPLSGAAFGYWVTSIVGCSILFLVAAIFIGILIWWLVLEILNKLNKLKEA